MKSIGEAKGGGKVALICGAETTGTGRTGVDITYVCTEDPNHSTDHYDSAFRHAWPVTNRPVKVDPEPEESAVDEPESPVEGFWAGLRTWAYTGTVEPYSALLGVASGILGTLVFVFLLSLAH